MKPIKAYPDYSIDADRNVYSTNYSIETPVKKLKTYIDNYGHESVTIYQGLKKLSVRLDNIE